MRTTALLFVFPFPGPWGKELTKAACGLAQDIAGEDGLVWKIWLENQEFGQAGGIYLFENSEAASRYRRKHESRLAALGLAGVTAQIFSVNTDLSILTGAQSALEDPAWQANPARTGVTVPA